MFREMRRQKHALTYEECVELLKTEKRGVLSLLGDDDYPYGVPINHYYDEETKKIYFHGAMIGHRVDAAGKHDKVSFCVFDKGYAKEGDWALNVKSVVIFGRIRKVEDYDRTIEISRKLSYKFTDDDSYIDAEIKKSGAATLAYEIEIEHMTGKLVRES